MPVAISGASITLALRVLLIGAMVFRPACLYLTVCIHGLFCLNLQLGPNVILGSGTALDEHVRVANATLGRNVRWHLPSSRPSTCPPALPAQQCG